MLNSTDVLTNLTCAHADSFLGASTSSEIAAALKFLDETQHLRTQYPYFSRDQVRAHRRTERSFRNLELHITSMATSSVFREQCLAEIKALSCFCRIHDHSPIYEPFHVVSSDEEVVFTITCLAHVYPVCIRYCLDASVLTRRGHTSVVHTPRWAYHVLKHAIHPRLTDPKSGRRIRDSDFEVGQPALAPSSDMLESALTLWTDDSASPYYQFHAAVDAARLLG